MMPTALKIDLPYLPNARHCESPLGGAATQGRPNHVGGSGLLRRKRSSQ
jgi:hypothetical protein